MRGADGGHGQGVSAVQMRLWGETLLPPSSAAAVHVISVISLAPSQICLFCWHKINNTGNGLCPACRQPYDPANFKVLAIVIEKLVAHRPSPARNCDCLAAETVGMTLL